MQTTSKIGKISKRKGNRPWFWTVPVSMYVRYRLFEYAEFFADLDECGDTLVELALVMRS